MTPGTCETPLWPAGSWAAGGRWPPPGVPSLGRGLDPSSWTTFGVGETRRPYDSAQLGPGASMTVTTARTPEPCVTVRGLWWRTEKWAWWRLEQRDKTGGGPYTPFLPSVRTFHSPILFPSESSPFVNGSQLGVALPPRGYWTVLEAFLMVTAAGGGAPGIQGLEARGVAQHPAVHRTPPQPRTIQPQMETQLRMNLSPVAALAGPASWPLADASLLLCIKSPPASLSPLSYHALCSLCSLAPHSYPLSPGQGCGKRGLSRG